ncbi:MAG: hypothetical protein ABS95_01210 [Verrucomicrobia bacterium SCN 57-15]|nr:MAG: hypothetical protein ABS95_01210 [Verrucomicrobia bacterium SCN 57-15]
MENLELIDRLDAVRKELTEDVRDVRNKLGNHMADTGYLKGAQQMLIARLERVEQRLDNLIFQLLEQRQNPVCSAESDPKPKTPLG